MLSASEFTGYSLACATYFSTCCLDSKKYAASVSDMRTTVTIDSDTEHLLREEVARTGKSLKEVMNQSIRRDLRRPASQKIRVQPIFVAPFPAEFAEMSMNRMADELDDEETVRELAR